MMLWDFVQIMNDTKQFLAMFVAILTVKGIPEHVPLICPLSFLFSLLFQDPSNGLNNRTAHSYSNTKETCQFHSKSAY